MGQPATIDYRAVIERNLIGHPEGLALDELLQRSGLKVDRSTFFRHLTRLIKDGRAERIGRARASRYRLLGVARIRAHLALPYAQRPAIGYAPEFLQRYLPNKIPFLSTVEIGQLREAGRVEMGAAPAGTYARRIYERLMIDLSYASSKLEGSTYNLLETERLVRLGEELSDRDRKEAVMILNHKEAIRFVVDNLATVDLTRRDLFDLHALLSDGLLADPADSGRLRHSLVKIGGSAYTPLDNPYRLNEEFELLLAKLAQVNEPFEKAFCLFVFLPYLQVFEDVNKRTSRVGLNIPLLKHDLCPLSFITVDERAYIDGASGVYELNDVALLKQAFIDGYVRSAEHYRHVRAELDNVSVGSLEYRAVVKEAVRAMVRERKRCDDADLRAFLSPLVKPQHLHEVCAAAKAELTGLHQGNLIRFGLSQAEFLSFVPPVSRKKT